MAATKTAPRDLAPTRVDDAIRLVFRLVHEFVTSPVTMAALLYNKRIHPAYGMTPWKRLRLAWRIYRNQFRIFTATTWKAHLAMAAKLLEIDPEVEGVVVECGCFRGGSSVNLSLICDIVGRELILSTPSRACRRPRRESGGTGAATSTPLRRA